MTLGLYYNGNWQKSISGVSIEIKNPLNQRGVGQSVWSDAEDMVEVLKSGAMGQNIWSKVTAYERSVFLGKLYKGIMTKENGKPYSESLGEVLYAASFVQWYSEEAKRVYGKNIPSQQENRRIMTIKQGVGLVYAITPWNFPLAMITRKMAPALAAGCSFVIKPSEETPLTAIKLFEIIHEIGLPKGVVNILIGNPEKITAVAMKDPKVRKISFTGSTAVGKKLFLQSGDTMKRISLELGGHAPLIVFDDASIEKAVQGTMQSKFRNCGQACIASNRIYIHNNIEEQFVKALKKEVLKLKVGDGLSDQVNIGPIINENGFNKIKNQIKDAIDKGAKVITGGKCEVNEFGGFVVEPTILSGIKPEMTIYFEETFGPVIPLITFEDGDEVIKMANDSNYGLAAYVFTESMSRGLRTSEALEYGIVGFNTGSVSTAQAPFGGYKESGIGREGGQEGIDSYLETKYIAIEL
jgi:succinate-semialdehyde dehydrogenase/glutarate-semialdehyde dehydrogenase